MAHITGTNLCSVEAASSLRAHTPHTRTVSWSQPLPLTGHCVVPSLAVDPCEHENALDAPDVGAPHVGVQAVVVVQHCKSIEEDERRSGGEGGKHGAHHRHKSMQCRGSELVANAHTTHTHRVSVAAVAIDGALRCAIISSEPTRALERAACGRRHSDEAEAAVIENGGGAPAGRRSRV